MRHVEGAVPAPGTAATSALSPGHAAQASAVQLASNLQAALLAN